MKKRLLAVVLSAALVFSNCSVIYASEDTNSSVVNDDSYASSEEEAGFAFENTAEDTEDTGTESEAIGSGIEAFENEIDQEENDISGSESSGNESASEENETIPENASGMDSDSPASDIESSDTDSSPIEDDGTVTNSETTDSESTDTSNNNATEDSSSTAPVTETTDTESGSSSEASDSTAAESDTADSENSNPTENSNSSAADTDIIATETDSDSTSEETSTESTPEEETLLDELAITEVSIAEGYYVLNSVLNTAFALDINGGAAIDGAKAQIYRSNYTPAQVFKITPVTKNGKKRYTIRPVSAISMGLAVDASSLTTQNSAKVLQRAAEDTDAQLWYFSEGKNGGYCIYSNLSANHVLDIFAGKANNGTYVQVYKANGTKAQEWQLTRVDGESIDDGLYTIRSKKLTGKVLDIAANKLTNGANVQIYNSNNSAAQKFWIEKQTGKYSRIRGYASGMSMDVAAAKYSDGTNIQLYKINSSAAQTFILENTGAKVGGEPVVFIKSSGGPYVEPSGTNVQLGSAGGYWLLESASESRLLKDGLYSIRSELLDTKAVDIAAASLSAGGKAQIYNWNASNAQKFQVQYSAGKTTIRALQSGMYLTNTGGTAVNGNRITQQISSGTAAQWKLVPTGDGTGSYSIAYAADPGYLMDVYGRKTANGTAVQLYQKNGSVAQRFYFQPTSIKIGWQKYLGAKRYVYNTDGEFFTDVTEESSSSGDRLGDRVTWIGDSYTIGGGSEIFKQLPGVLVNAKIRRRYGTDIDSNPCGLNILREMKKNGELREILVFALSTNDRSLSYQLAEQVLTIAGQNTTVILMTAGNRSDLNYTEINASIREIAQWNNNVYLADWENYSSDKLTKYFSEDDPIHPTLSTGYKDWTALIVDAIEEAEQGYSGPIW